MQFCGSFLHGQEPTTFWNRYGISPLPPPPFQELQRVARPEPVFGLRVDYSSILALSLSEARVLVNGVPSGVSVREIAPNSPAAAAFKKLGDRPERWLITQVNGTAVTTPAEFYKAAKGRESVKLTMIDPTELNRKDREVTLP